MLYRQRTDGQRVFYVVTVDQSEHPTKEAALARSAELHKIQRAQGITLWPSDKARRAWYKKHGDKI